MTMMTWALWAFKKTWRTAQVKNWRNVWWWWAHSSVIFLSVIIMLIHMLRVTLWRKLSNLGFIFTDTKGISSKVKSSRLTGGDGGVVSHPFGYDAITLKSIQLSKFVNCGFGWVYLRFTWLERSSRVSPFIFFTKFFRLLSPF